MNTPGWTKVKTRGVGVDGGVIEHRVPTADWLPRSESKQRSGAIEQNGIAITLEVMSVTATIPQRISILYSVNRVRGCSEIIAPLPVKIETTRSPRHNNLLYLILTPLISRFLQFFQDASQASSRPSWYALTSRSRRAIRPAIYLTSCPIIPCVGALDLSRSPV